MTTYYMRPLIQWREIRERLRLNKIYQGLRVSDDRPRYIFYGKSREYYRRFHPNKKTKAIFPPLGSTRTKDGILIPGLKTLYRPIVGGAPDTYYLREDGTAANKGAATGPGSTQANCMNVSVHNGETFSAGDLITMCDDGGIITSQISPPSDGTGGNHIVYEAESGDTPILDGGLDVTSASYKWTASGSGTNEYYLEDSGGGDPGIVEPRVVMIDALNLRLAGTLGSLVDHKWAWGDNDALGYSTLYVRDDTGDPDVSGVTIIASQGSQGFALSSDDYITIDGLSFRYFKYRAIYMGGCTDVTIQNCTIVNIGTHGIEAEATCFNLDINNCDISYVVRSNGIWLSDTEDSEIYQNEAYQCQSNGIGLTAESDNNKTHRNWCHDNSINDASAGIGLESNVNDCEVYYNLLTNNSHAGIVVNAQRNEIYNNVIYSSVESDTINGSSVNLTDWGGGSAENNTFKNNIFIATGSDEKTVYIGDVSNRNNIFDYNIHYHPDKSASYDIISWSGVWPSFATWQSTYSQDVNGQLADPLFTNPGGDDFTLQVTSPCINAGVNVGLTEDYAGGKVPQGARPDIGAYEFPALSTLTLTGAG